MIPLFITTSSINPSDFTVHYTPAIDVDPNAEYEIGLIKLFIWNNHENISTAKNNNTLRYSSDSGATWKTIVFADGTYSLPELNDAINDFLDLNGDTSNSIILVPNLS